MKLKKKKKKKKRVTICNCLISLLETQVQPGLCGALHGAEAGSPPGSLNPRQTKKTRRKPGTWRRSAKPCATGHGRCPLLALCIALRHLSNNKPPPPSEVHRSDDVPLSAEQRVASCCPLATVNGLQSCPAIPHGPDPRSRVSVIGSCSLNCEMHQYGGDFHLK